MPVNHPALMLITATAARTMLFTLLSLWLLVQSPRSRADDLGKIAVTFEFNQPVLSWSNRIGQSYVLLRSTNLDASNWQRVATLTSDAPDVSWADDHAEPHGAFYKVQLAQHVVIFQQLQSALERACATQQIVGASAAALLSQEGLWLGTAGNSHDAISIRAYTPFEFGSVTKSYIAATVLKLVEEGKLSLEDTVGRWLPSLPNTNIPPEVTIRQLLNHRAGTYNFGDDPEFRAALLGFVANLAARAGVSLRQSTAF